MVNYLKLILKKVNAIILYIIYGNRLNQLELFLPPIKMKAKDIVVPEGFLLRNFEEQDVDDLFGRYNSQRQFYTMPSTTVPNDQKSFAEWLYKTPETCKENSLCLKYEDNRYNK